MPFAGGGGARREREGDSDPGSIPIHQSREADVRLCVAMLGAFNSVQCIAVQNISVK